MKLIIEYFKSTNQNQRDPRQLFLQVNQKGHNYLGTAQDFLFPPMNGTPSLAALCLASADAFLRASSMRMSSAVGDAMLFARVR